MGLEVENNKKKDDVDQLTSIINTCSTQKDAQWIRHPMSSLQPRQCSHRTNHPRAKCWYLGSGSGASETRTSRVASKDWYLIHRRSMRGPLMHTQGQNLDPPPPLPGPRPATGAKSRDGGCLAGCPAHQQHIRDERMSQPVGAHLAILGLCS